MGSLSEVHSGLVVVVATGRGSNNPFPMPAEGGVIERGGVCRTGNAR